MSLKRNSKKMNKIVDQDEVDNEVDEESEEENIKITKKKQKKDTGGSKDDKKDSGSQTVYHGELKCQSKTKECNNNAYFYVSTNKLYLCGVHSKAFKEKAKPLPKVPKQEKERRLELKQEEENKKIEAARLINVAKSSYGEVRLSPLKMMKSPEQMDGYLKIFPNFKHGGRKDGLGMPTLSPKHLGPVNHPQPNVPPAKNIENFHQGSKCFSIDLEEDGSVGAKFWASRNKMFEDEDPHRHKYKDSNGKPLIPKFFVFYDKDGKEHRLGVIECRQFYCNYYERLVKEQEQYEQLVQLYRNGTNIQIVGYDARHVPSDRVSIVKEYHNPSKPFGHELVLFAMLLIHDESQYPWRINKSFDF